MLFRLLSSIFILVTTFPGITTLIKIKRTVELQLMQLVLINKMIKTSNRVHSILHYLANRWIWIIPCCTIGLLGIWHRKVLMSRWTMDRMFKAQMFYSLENGKVHSKRTKQWRWCKWPKVKSIKLNWTIKRQKWWTTTQNDGSHLNHYTSQLVEISKIQSKWPITLWPKFNHQSYLRKAIKRMTRRSSFIKRRKWTK